MTYNDNQPIQGHSLAVHDESTIVQRIACSAVEFEALKRGASEAPQAVKAAPAWLTTPGISDDPMEGTAHGYGLLKHDEGTITEWISYSRAEFDALKARLAAMRS